MENKNKKGLGGFFLGLAALGGGAYLAKKVLDLYSQAEDSTMTQEDYLYEIAQQKAQYGSLENQEFFAYDLIDQTSRSGALFAKFLREVNRNWEIPSKVLRISDIEKLLDFSQSQLEDRWDYGEAIMEILAGANKQDYLIFLGSSNLPEIFQKELAREEGDSFYWRRFGQARFIINPKYIRENFK